MKKKILTLALVLALVAIMVGGSLAYFTDNDEVTNTFTVGSVKIEIFENGELTKEDVVTFEEPLVPVVNADPSQDSGYIEKAVDVHNTGVNAAYIRTHIAIPTNLVGYLYLDLDETGWNRQADSTAVVGNVNYTVFTYDYNTALESGKNTGDLLKGVYLGSDVDLKEDSDGNLWFVRKVNGEIIHESGFQAHTKSGDAYTSEKVNILVASQAIQAQGFENSTVSEALTTGFPAHPWPTA